MLRLVQAFVQILLAYPLLLHLSSALLFPSPIDKAAAAANDLIRSRATLSVMRSRIALTRRILRTFRFLESFHIAHKVYVKLSFS